MELLEAAIRLLEANGTLPQEYPPSQTALATTQAFGNAISRATG